MGQNSHSRGRAKRPGTGVRGEATGVGDGARKAGLRGGVGFQRGSGLKGQRRGRRRGGRGPHSTRSPSPLSGPVIPLPLPLARRHLGPRHPGPFPRTQTKPKRRGAGTPLCQETRSLAPIGHIVQLATRPVKLAAIGQCAGLPRTRTGA